MRKKYCTLHNKTVYAKICLDCGKLREAENMETGETRFYCSNLYEKVTFIGPHTDKWRKRMGQKPESLPLGRMERYLYDLLEIAAYSKK